MKTIRTRIISISLLMLATTLNLAAQNKPWTLDDCINYALSKNIQIQQAALSGERNQLYSKQAQAAKLPSLSGSVRKNFNWSKSAASQTEEYGNLNGSNSTSYSLGSSMILYNGMKTE